MRVGVFFMINMRIFKKNARKICIYQNKVVLLHRQNKLRGRMTAKSAAFILSVGVVKHIVSAPRAKAVMA